MLPPISSIGSIGSLPSVDQLSLKPAATAAEAGEFSKVLHSTIQGVAQSQNSASTAVNNFLNGNEGELHSTILAAQKADLQFDMFLQVRNKVVSAYQEVMKMQL